MKKILTTILLSLLVILLSSCNQNKLKVGVFGNYDKNTKTMISDLLVNDNLASDSKNIKYIKIKNIDEAFSFLKDNKINLIISDETISKYYCSRNAEYVYKVLDKNCLAKHSLCFSSTSQYLLDGANQIIQDFKDERFLESINNIYITGVIDNGDPSFIDFVKIPYSSLLLRVGFTGNLAPIDMVDGEDRPCGYSNKILNEIAKRLKANLILVKLDSDTKVDALKKNEVDFLYEVTNYNNDCGETDKDLFSSISYYESPITYIKLK